MYIGGQAFVIKLRETEERSPSAMLLEPPFGLNGSDVGDIPPRWRQMKYVVFYHITTYAQHLPGMRVV